MKEKINTPTLTPTQTNSAVCELEQIEEIAQLSGHMTEKTCNSCIHFGACSKWTDFPKQCGVPVCASFAQQREGEWIDKPTGAYSRMHSWCKGQIHYCNYGG